MTDHDLALLESTRKTLNAPDSSLQELVTASAIVENFRREAWQSHHAFVRSDRIVMSRQCAVEIGDLGARRARGGFGL